MKDQFRFRNVIGALLALGVVAVVATGCQPEHDHDHDAHADGEGDGGHAHTPPHGGAPVLLGDHFYHLEFVLDLETGVLDAYCLDGHLENFIRLPLEGIDLILSSVDGTPALRLLPVASSATGETVGDTSHFRVQSDVLVGAAQFEALLGRIEIGGQVFDQVRFSYPEGNEE